MLFSSVAGVWGGGRAGRLRRRATPTSTPSPSGRRGRGLPATSVAWGAWAGGGMAADDGAPTSGSAAAAWPPCDPDRAVAALAQALAARRDHRSWSPTSTGPGSPRRSPLARPSPLLDDLPEVGRGAAAAPAGRATCTPPASALRASGSPASPGRAAAALLDLVRAEAAAVLGHAAADGVGPTGRSGTSASTR